MNVCVYCVKIIYDPQMRVLSRKHQLVPCLHYTIIKNILFTQRLLTSKYCLTILLLTS